MKNPWVIVAVLAVVLIGGSVWYSGVVTERNNEGVSFTSHIKGNAEAAVTLVEYSDLQCPACAAFEPYVKDVMETYGASIRFEYKHFPLPIHAMAEPAARAAEAAGQQGKFYEFSEKLFAEQATWSVSPNPAGLYLKYAGEMGLDVDLFKRHMNSSLVREKISAEMQEGRSLGVTGTPTFFLNGQKMVINSYEDFRAQIEAAINPAVEFTLPE
jgi:protein-disulfide isomerase